MESLLGPSAAACNEIINISAGALATLEVARNLERTKGVGEAGFQNIVQQRIISSEVGFFEKISKNKLNTFHSLVTSTKVVSKERAIVLRADRALFARMLVIVQNWQMDMRMVLKFDFGALPLFLVSQDGSLTKTTKAKLLALIEGNTAPAAAVPPNAARVLDAMALLQAVQKIPGTFSELAGLVFEAVTRSSAQRVDFVADQYPEISIKAGERG